MRSRRVAAATLLAMAVGVGLAPVEAQQPPPNGGLRMVVATPPIHSRRYQSIEILVTLENTNDKPVEVMVVGEPRVSGGGGSWPARGGNLMGIPECGPTMPLCDNNLARERLKPLPIDAKGSIIVTLRPGNVFLSEIERISFTLPLAVRPEHTGAGRGGPWRQLSLSLTNIAVESR